MTQQLRKYRKHTRLKSLESFPLDTTQFHKSPKNRQAGNFNEGMILIEKVSRCIPLGFCEDFYRTPRNVHKVHIMQICTCPNK